MLKYFFLLIRSALYNQPIDDAEKEQITPEILPALYKISKRHDLTHLVGEAIDKNGLFPEDTDVRKAFLRERDMAIYRYQQIRYEYKRICDTLSNAKISFLPLKGSVLRDYYPSPWMRTSCDIDILVKPEDVHAAYDTLMEQLSYRGEGISSKDAHLYSPSGVHLEIRYNNKASNPKWQPILDSIWDNMVNPDDCQLKLTNEAFYFYHMEHMAGHFLYGGCGVRFFLDVWVMNRELSFDESEKKRFLTEAGIDAFADAVEETAKCWFGDGKCSDLVSDIEEYIINAGMYGDMKNRVAIQKTKRGGKIKYLKSRIFLPYDKLKHIYPILQKHRALYPFCQVRRWFRLFRKDTKGRITKEFNEATQGDSDKSERIVRMFEQLNI